MTNAMLARAFFGFLLLAVPVWAQVEPDASGGSPSSDDEFQMSMPTQVSGKTYSLGSRSRSNYFAGGLVYTTAYDDNILAGQSTDHPIGATSFAIYPSVSYQQKTPRQMVSLNYGAGFTFFHPTTELNQANQTATVGYDYRFTRHSSLSVQDSFGQNSTVFSQPYTLYGTSVSGSTVFEPTQIIVPYAGQLSNSTAAQVGYQFSRSAMVGAAGSYQFFRYSDLTQVSTLNNSNSGGGLGFYSRRLTKSQFFGAMYRYSHITTFPLDSTSQSQVVSLFYAINPGERFSLSVTAGPQIFSTRETGSPESSKLGASVQASCGWNGSRVGVATSYSHAYTSGQGLTGAYKSDSFNAGANWRFARQWNTGINGAYYDSTNVIPVTGASVFNGHTLFGTALISRGFGEHLTVEADYRRLHQDYGGSSAISPDDNRVSVALTYSFSRPVGR